MAAVSAAAATLTIDIEADGGEFSVRLRSVDVQGVSHVSLPEFIDQCGGYCRVEPARVSADVLGRSLVLGINDTKVQSSQDQFALAHPIIRYRGEVLIATDDLDTLVSKGLGGAIKRPEGEEAVPPPQDDPPVEATPDTTPLTTSTRNEALPPPLPLNARRDQRGEAATIDTVIIDPGHGGTDPGYVSAAGFAEKDLALAVALALRDILKETTSLKTYITRSEDVSVEPEDRVVLARKQSGDFFISIHGAASFSESAVGLGVYYTPRPAEVDAIARIRRRRPGLPFTDTVRDHSAQSLQAAQAMEAAIASTSGTEKIWVREAPVRILREVGMAGVLVEVGHLTNPAEAALMESRSEQEKIARGLAAGIATLVGGTP